MSAAERKRLSFGGVASPSSKRQRRILSVKEKQEIFDNWREFKSNKEASLLRARKSRPKDKKPPHNNNHVTASWCARPRKFEDVSKTTWKFIIQLGIRGDEWRQSGGQRSLDDEQEKRLAEHVKSAGFHGHLVTNNAIRIWALECFVSSDRFQNSEEDAKLRILQKIGGKKWVRKFKERHKICLSDSVSALELPRAQKSQPENLVDFYRHLITLHAMSQVHFEARRLLEADVTLAGVSLNTELPFPQITKSSHSVESMTTTLRRIPGNSFWKPGLSDLAQADFFFER